MLDICQQMVSEKVPIQGVGGIHNGELGTDPKRIKQAILEVNQDMGVVVIVGIGSAILAAEVATESLGQTIRCAIADAPLVEGGLAAALETSIGGSFEEVFEAAELAKSLKKC